MVLGLNLRKTQENVFSPDVFLHVPLRAVTTNESKYELSKWRYGLGYIALGSERGCEDEAVC